MKKSIMGSTAQQARKQAKGIVESYGNPWDILAELLQNAIDAIRKVSDNRHGQLHIIIDQKNKTIIVIENGIGMEPSKMPYHLQTFSTNKEGDNSLVGKKGVGVDYVILVTQSFVAISGTSEGVTKVVVNGAREWVESNEETELEMDISDVTHEYPNFVGTSITAADLEDSDIFHMSFEHIETVIRTKTAVGNTNVLFGKEDLKVRVLLEVIGKGGESQSKEIPFKYQLPTEALHDTELISMDEFEEKYSRSSVKDSRKVAALKDKVVTTFGEVDYKHNRTLRYMACYVPTRSTWNTLAKRLGLLPDLVDKQAEKDYMEQFEYVFPSSGIYTSVKGMPTGISIDHPVVGDDGYWPNTFILIEDPGLSFDIGRKVIYAPQQKILKKISRKIFKRFVHGNIPSYLSKNISRATTFDRYKVHQELVKGVKSVNSCSTSYVKEPNGQESNVNNRFFELAGGGFLEGYQFLSAGYKQIYDLYALREDNFLAFEFKSKLINILKEFGESKGFEQLDCIVCWDVDEQDIKGFDKENIEIELLNEETLSPGSDLFPLATHQLHLPNVHKRIFVMDLKRIQEAIDNGIIEPNVKPIILNTLKNRLIVQKKCPICDKPE